MEFLVALIVIGSLLAMLLPATRSTRESARRMQCSNHLKQIGIALHNYHDVFQSLPYGARARCVSKGSENTCDDSSMQQGWGPSWVMSLLPFAEASPLSDLLETSAQANPDGWATDVTTKAPGRAGYHVHDRKIAWLLCPSSLLPQVENLRGSTFPTSVVPSYVGISGATNHGANQLSTETSFMEMRVKPGPAPTDLRANANGGAKPPCSHQSCGGLLTVNECYGMATCIDGTSNSRCALRFFFWQVRKWALSSRSFC